MDELVEYLDIPGNYIILMPIVDESQMHSEKNFEIDIDMLSLLWKLWNSAIVDGPPKSFA